jgi:hypothetical protein
MTRFIYRIHPEGSIRPLVSGSGKVDSSDFSAIVRHIMARNGVTATQELHGPESIMAGCVFRTRFHFQGQAVTLAICPLAEDFPPFVSAEILKGAGA